MKLSEMQKNETSKSAQSFAQSARKNGGFGNQKDLNEAYEDLKNCSSDQLMQRLAKEIQQQKSSGVFDYDALMASLNQIKIYLPNETYENMIRIIESFK